MKDKTKEILSQAINYWKYKTEGKEIKLNTLWQFIVIAIFIFMVGRISGSQAFENAPDAMAHLLISLLSSPAAAWLLLLSFGKKEEK